jgi:hypothetical protein
MEVDWEVELGGAAPVIEAYWHGFVDLRNLATHSGPACGDAGLDRTGEIAEVANFPPLAELLRRLNAPKSSFWTSKCDVWEASAQELGVGAGEIGLACYVDLLPIEGTVYPSLREAEDACRGLVARIAAGKGENCRVDLVIRAAIAGNKEGLGITAYIGAGGADRGDAELALAKAMAVFADAIPPTRLPLEALESCN